VFGAVEVFLDESVGRKAGASGWGETPEFLAGAGDVKGQAAGGGGMGDGEGKAIHLVCAGIVGDFVAKQAKKRNHPGVAGEGGGGIGGVEAGEAALEEIAERACAGEDGGDFVVEGAAGIESEIGGFLAGESGGEN